MRKPDEERPHPVGMGVQRLYRFSNGYGASVVQTPWSYGGEEGKWELGVVKFNGEGWKFKLTYDTPITSDVVGHLTEEEVDNLLLKIEELPHVQA